MFFLILLVWFAMMIAPLLTKSWRTYGIVAPLVVSPFVLLLIFYFVSGENEKHDGYTELFLAMFTGGVILTSLARAVGLLLQGRGWTRLGVIWTEVLAFFLFGWLFLGFRW